MTYLKDLLARLLKSRVWVAAQFGGTLLLILVGLLWTRLPEKHFWQVALSLLLPVLLLISVLELQAGTMRSLANNDGRRFKLVWGALSLVPWIIVTWLAWAALDGYDDKIPLWAGYLNSQSSSHARATLLTWEHIQQWLGWLEWALRWVLVPAILIPFTVASAQWSYRLPWRRVLRVLLNWRWWPAVLAAALLAAALPGRFFVTLPSGTVSAQVWHVSLKLAAAYLLGIGSWVLLLAWAGVLFGHLKPLPEDDAATELFEPLCASRRWIGMQFGWVLMWIWVNVAVLHIPGIQLWPVWLSTGLGVSYRILIAIAALVVQAGMMRNLISNQLKRVHLVWGTLAMLLWSVLFIVADSMQTSLPGTLLQWALVWLIAPVVYIPFASASAMWGLRLPWRIILRILCAWRWWLAVLIAGGVGALLENCFEGLRTWPYVWDVDLATGLKMGAIDMLETLIWLLLLGWLAVLFNRTSQTAPEPFVEVPALAGPPEPE